ncbi:MAG: hypothetical protein C4321_04585 [Chloroflexota bacterium]
MQVINLDNIEALPDPLIGHILDALSTGATVVEVAVRLDLEVAPIDDERGVDPKSEVLVVSVRMLDGTYEWKAYGATYPHREALRRAGFRWDDQARVWWTMRQPNLGELKGVPGKLLTEPLPLYAQLTREWAAGHSVPLAGETR